MQKFQIKILLLGVFISLPTLSQAKGIGELFGKVMGISDSTYVLSEKTNSYANTFLFDNHQTFDFALSEGKQHLKVSPTSCPNLGVGVGYSIIALSYSKSINSILGKRQHNNSDFSFNIVANRWGLQIYKRKVNGDAKIVGSKGFLQGTARDASDFSWDGSAMTNGKPVDLKGETFDGFNSRETGVDFYYVFNFNHFSYKAAYGYSTRQMRSAGSVIAGLTYSDFRGDLVLTHAPFVDLDAYDRWAKGEIEFFTYVPCVSQEVDFRYRKLSVKVGYGYNWAFAHNWVFNATFYPVLSVKWSKVTTYSLDDLEKQQQIYHGDWSLDFMGRSSVQWNNGKMYAGVYGDFTTFKYKKPEVNISQLYSEVRVCFGVYFNLFRWKKK